MTEKEKKDGEEKMKKTEEEKISIEFFEEEKKMQTRISCRRRSAPSDRRSQMGGFIPQAIHQRVKITEAIANGVTVQEWNSTDKATTEIERVSNLLSTAFGLGSHLRRVVK